MTKGYWIAFADVHDPEGYKAYVAENAKAFRKYGGRFLARGGKCEAREGKPRARAVLVEFPTYQAAVECYQSAEYAKAMKLGVASGVCSTGSPPMSARTTSATRDMRQYEAIRL